MSLSDKEINQVLKLAYVSCDEETKQIYKKQLSKILDYMDILNTAETDHISIRDTMDSVSPALREDCVESAGIDITKLAPKIEDNCFVVPKILEE